MKKFIPHRKRRESASKSGSPRKEMQRSPVESDGTVYGNEQQRIKKWMKQVRFRKALLGGVDEADVWKKIGELNGLYEAALAAERTRYDVLLEKASEGATYSRRTKSDGQTMSGPKVERAEDETDG